MSLRGLRKLQEGGKGDLELDSDITGGACSDKSFDGIDDNDHTPVLPMKASNRFDLLLGGSQSESEVKEDDDLTEVADGKDEKNADGSIIGNSLQVHCTGARKKRRRKRKKGRPKLPASSEDQMDHDVDEVEQSVREVNAILGEAELCPNPTRDTEEKAARSLLCVEHKHLNPQNEMKRIFGSKVVQASESNRRRGRISGNRGGRGTWIVQSEPGWSHLPRPGVSMLLVENSSTHQVFKYQHSSVYQQAQFRFLEAVESLNPENIIFLLNMEPKHVDTLLQVSEIFRLGDDSARAAQLIERSIYVMEVAAHPLFNVTTGTCRLQYRQQENRSLFIALFRHILNVGQKGCYRTALELCKLLLNLSPDDDPLAVSLMLDFYALRAQKYAWLVALYDLYEPTKNLSMLPNFSFSVPLALYHLSEGNDVDANKDKTDKGKSVADAIVQTTEELRKRADDMLQRALIMFPAVLTPLLEKCSIQPDPIVAAHAFFGPNIQSHMNKGLCQIVSLFVGRNYHVWKEAGVMGWLEENVLTVLARVDSGDPVVKEGEDMRKLRYQGTPTAIYRHILMAEIKDATATLPMNLANNPVMSYDPLPPADTTCDYTRPNPPKSPSSNSSSILASFFRSLMPNYDPDAPDPEDGPEGEDGIVAIGGGAAAADGEGVGGVVVAAADGEEGGIGASASVGDLRASVNTLLEAMRDLLSNIHLPEPPGDDADQSEEEDQPNWEP